MSNRMKAISVLLIAIFVLAGFECFSRLERAHIDEEDLSKVYKKVVQLNGTNYIAVDDKGDIHHIRYMPYKDTIIIEYADITEGMIDWEAFKKEDKEKIKKRRRNAN